ncbi:tRNA-specific adenosine deaminase 1 [Amphibalanus amphitrite]|uniref:tRNA-specific adenosine deaminase 1 n=1 Tax=Amphibalanus amphitrite TaxID=1232801 RepID=A0A6A4X151_AMPAM|nr:tRNA-specific adenosine deaminase 1 [Amphibalanus amphitrite]
MAEVRRVVVDGGKSQWLEKEENGRCVSLKEGVRVHFFTSHTPCGDCSIFPRENETEGGTGDEPVRKKQRREEEDGRDRIALDGGEAAKDSSVSAKTVGTPATDTSDIYRTGAKPVVGETADPLQPGAGYHVTGVLRTKPGRGERTLSMSCSDKLARWLRLGLQGALLSCWLPQPLTLSSVVTGPCPYSEAAMRRALLSRPGLIVEPVLAQAGKEFEFSRTLVEGSAAEAVKVVPSPCAVAWSRGCTREFEVSVEGIRQGVTKKARGTPAARVAICRREVMQEFVELVKDVAPEQLPVCLGEEFMGAPTMACECESRPVRMATLLKRWKMRMLGKYKHLSGIASDSECRRSEVSLRSASSSRSGPVGGDARPSRSRPAAQPCQPIAA